MPSTNSSDRQDRAKNNSKLKSSIVHKPFATGTINIFNPYRNKQKSREKNNQLSPPKLFLNAELERDLEQRKAELAISELSELNLEPEEIEYRNRHWSDGLFNSWGISAVAILFLVNLISIGFIWRHTRETAVKTNNVAPPISVGNKHFGDREFIPLNLSTLGAIELAEDPPESTPTLAPIAPALAPLENIASLSVFNSPYHYILTEYTGEASLAEAQQKVKQVSLVNFPQGVFIYLGAFKNREDAKQFTSQLQQENFSAYVYPLD